MKRMAMLCFLLCGIGTSYACRIQFNVRNMSGTTISGAQVSGPALRMSAIYKLNDKQWFSYTAKNGLTSCYGKYVVSTNFYSTETTIVINEDAEYNFVLYKPHGKFKVTRIG